MHVRNYCRACPVCKAGVDIDKARRRRRAMPAQLLTRLLCSVAFDALRLLCSPRSLADPALTPRPPQVIPIYGRGSDERIHPAVKAQPVPPRPAGQRPAAVMMASQHTASHQGMLPALFGLQLGPGQAFVEALTPEQQHQAFLSRLLLMLGSFVIMCLLLF